MAEGSIGGKEVLMANKQSVELTKPCVGAFDDRSALVASELPSVVVLSVLAVVAIRDDEVDAALLESLAQPIGVVSAVGNYAFRLLPGTALGARDFDFGECGFRTRNFSRRGAFEPNSRWRTATVDQYHPLRPLAALGLADGGAPFFAWAKLPFRNVSSHFSRPSPSSAPGSARHASSHTTCTSHCINRRPLVAEEVHLSGRDRRARLQNPQDTFQTRPVAPCAVVNSEAHM